jgi:hypothetical protein
MREAAKQTTEVAEVDTSPFSIFKKLTGVDVDAGNPPNHHRLPPRSAERDTPEHRVPRNATLEPGLRG